METAIRAAIVSATGNLSFDGWQVSIGQGFREDGLGALVELGLKRTEAERGEQSGDQLTWVPVVHYETPVVLLGKRSVKLFLSFEAGLLQYISIAIEGLEWWTREGHQENLALREQLFAKRRRFKGGRIWTRFETNTGALCDGGTLFHLVYDQTAAETKPAKKPTTTPPRAKNKA